MKTGFSDNYSEKMEKYRDTEKANICRRWVYKWFVKFPFGIEKGHNGKLRRVQEEVDPMKGGGMKELWLF